MVILPYRIVKHMEEELSALRQQLEDALKHSGAAGAEAQVIREELEVERKLRRAAEEEQKSLHRLLEAELEEI